ncbi:MAG: S-layer homology domain-containing protein, partial [Clostridiales Family XIII bacterium]|nr:S-layer homology domain-containing protein [Clostridiales Family XIII bacterium]
MNGRYVCAGLGDAARLRLFGCGERTGARRRMCAAILIGLLAALLPLCAGTARAAMNFSDAVGHWADDEIRAGVEFGYISGFPDNSFQPDNAITRAEFVKAVNAAMGFTELGNIAFLDVSPNDWYYDEVRKAASAGYITGAGNNMFFPQNLITREEAAVVLYRLDNDRRLVTALPFVDNRRISPWALDAVRHAFAMDYMTGSPDPTPPNGPPRPGVAVAIPIAPLWFYPNNNDLNVNPVAPPNSGNLKRAEAVSILNRFIKIDRNHRMITELSALYATDLTAYFSVRSHTAGRLFWEIIPASYPAPDAQQIAGGLMANGQPAPLKDDLTLTANRETKFNIFLPHDNTYYANIPEYNGAYTLYAVVRVGNGVNMRLSVVASVDFSTGDTGDWAEDWLAPLNVRAVTANTAVMDFTSSESGNLYYVVMPRTRGVPTQADIFAGRGWNMDPADNQNVGNGVAAVRGVAGAVTLTGLKPGTDYTVYAFVIKDQERFFPAGRYPNWRSDDATALGA